MTVKGKTVYHCHGRRKGKPIKTHSSHAAAVRHHKAIMSRKK